MKLQNSALVRFIKARLRKRKLKQELASKKAFAHTIDPFSIEYTYYVAVTDNNVLSARIEKNGEPYCMYHSLDGFYSLVSYGISPEEQRMILSDLENGTVINGLTICHAKPTKLTFIEDLKRSIRKLRCS